MSSEPDHRDRTRQLFTELQANESSAARAELIELHLRFAEQLAWRFNNRGLAIEDLKQVAALGLVMAVDRFEPDRGFEFRTFATPTIVGELKRHFRDKGWSVRVPRRIQELHLRVSEAVGRLAQQLGRSPTIDEIAREVGTSQEEVLEAMEAAESYRAASLDAPRFEGDSLGDRIGQDDQNLFRRENRVALEAVIGILEPRERLIIQLHFMEEMTQREVADRLGVSQMHISRLLAKSLARLRAAMDDGKADR